MSSWPVMEENGAGKQLQCKCDASLRNTAVQTRELSGVMPELILGVGI